MYCDGIKLITLKNKTKNNNENPLNSSSSDDECVPPPAIHEESPQQQKGLLKMWENGGPVKLLRYPGDAAKGYLFFKNYQNLDYDGLKDLIAKSGSSFLSMRQYGDNYIKVRIKHEEHIRMLYTYLKQNKKYEVSILIDMDDYHEQKIKQRQLVKLAKYKGLKVVRKTNEDLLNDVAAANEMDSHIKFEMKPSIEKSPPSRVEKEKTRVEKEKTPSPKSGMIGTWNGHVVVMPDIPAPRLSQEPQEEPPYTCSPISRTNQSGSSDNSVNSEEYCMLVNNKPADKEISRENQQNKYSKNYENNRIGLRTKKGSNGRKASHPHVKPPVWGEHNASHKSNTKAPSINTQHDDWETSSNEEFLQCFNRLRIRSASRRKQSAQRNKATSEGSSSSSEYRSSSSSDIYIDSPHRPMTPPREVPEEPGLISIFDIMAYLMRKSVLNNLETSFHVDRK